jgi:hypothetical protein
MAEAPHKLIAKIPMGYSMQLAGRQKATFSPRLSPNLIESPVAKCFVVEIISE